ncbi:MAG: Blue-light-activated protein [Chloroflexi bacterium]|nr:Blue-light-activated protein [Chloroflexota bacterium]
MEREGPEESRYRGQRLLLDIGTSLLRSDDIAAFLDESIDRIMAWGAYDLVAIRLNDRGDAAGWVATRGIRDTANAPRFGFANVSFAPDALRAARETLVFEDLNVAGRLRTLQVEEGVVGVVWVPVQADEILLGHMLLGVRTPREFPRSEVGLVTAIGSQLGFAAQKAFLSEESRLAREQLQQSQKLEAVGVLAGGMAHNLNNLLTIILGYGRLLEQELRGTDRQRGFVDEIITAGERAADLTQQLLAFSRKQLLQPRVLDLNRLVLESADLLRELATEKVVVVMDLAPDLGLVHTDPSQLGQVLINLVTNARDAMSNGGQITIQTSNVELDENYRLRRTLVRPGRYVMLAIGDTGSGIEASVQEHLFEPFFTTREEGAGLGLGLASVYGIVKQSEGYVWAYSEAGVGTVFKVYLPIHGRSGLAPSTNDNRESAGGKTILLVEDDPSLQRFAVTALESFGYRVLAASEADGAIRQVADSPGIIDLLLTDLTIANEHGRDLAERVVELSPETRVLYMSGFPSSVAAAHGLLDSDAPFLQKPFSASALAGAVSTVLFSVAIA